MTEFKVETYRILDCTDWAEKKALRKVDEAEYDLFVSARIVNMGEDSLVRTKLWAMFPEGTITGDALRDIGRGLIRPPDAPIEEE